MMAKFEMKKRIHSDVLSEESSDNESGLGATAVRRQKTGGGIAAALMAKMGYKEGRGLGKEEQGIIDPLRASEQKGRRGLGFTLADVVVSDDLKWSEEQEKKYVSVEEEVVWMPEPVDPPPTDQLMLRDWITRGPRPVRMEEQTEFCDPEVVENVCLCKSVFDRLSNQELRSSRSGSNPFETIGKVFFQNRAALKMANMDARFDMMFTDPKNEKGQSLLESKDLLYFADICAGPGGFSEYVLWRKKWEARGFGFTLTGPNNFKLDEFLAASTETFEPHYGSDAVDGNGDIYDPQNLIAFRNFVLENSGNGVHFVMADGGFSVEGQENNQEILSKRLYLCQFLCALGILKTGGHFVCKLFDCFTSFSVGLIYLMYQCFDHVCIFKPNTSRPANSERYLICKSKKSGTSTVENHLFLLNCMLDAVDKKQTEASDDIIEIIPLDVLKKDSAFFDYMTKSNADMGRRQILFLTKVKAFAEDPSLTEPLQNEIRRKCLKEWGVPEQIRTVPPKVSAVTKFRELMQIPAKLNEEIFQTKPTNLTRNCLKSLQHHNSFRGIILSEDPVNPSGTSRMRGFILSLAKYDAHFWDLSPGMVFTQLANMKLNLPPGTLLYVEQVYEMMREGRGQKKVLMVHVIDALFLGDMDVRHKELSARLLLADKLIRAVRKPTVPGLTTMRVKQLFDLTDLEAVFTDDLEMREFKSGNCKFRLAYNSEDKTKEKNDVKYVEVSGLLIVPLVTHRYLICWSKSRRQQYYFEKATGKSEFSPPPGVFASVMDCFKHSFFWKWESNGRNTKDGIVSTDIADPDILDRDSFRRFFLSIKTGP